MTSLLSEKVMWDKEPLEKVKWKELHTAANHNLAFIVFREAGRCNVNWASYDAGASRVEVP